LNPKWGILKLFNEKEFFKIVQSKGRYSSHLLGKLPKPLSIKIEPTSEDNTHIRKLISSFSNSSRDLLHSHHNIHGSNSTGLSYLDNSQVF
jgi:hypothetical protein